VLQEKLDEDWASGNVGVFAISSGDPEFYARGFKQDCGVELPFLLDEYYEDSDICADYKINKVPAIDFWSLFVLDGRGVVRFAGRGMGSIDYRVAWDEVAALIEAAGESLSFLPGAPPWALTP